MNILLNDKPMKANSPSLLELVKQHTTDEQACAIAVNDEFVPRSEYHSTLLNDGDRIELLVPMQGG